MTGNFGIALLLTAAAGAATGVGSLIAAVTDRNNRRFLAASLGFSAGVMIYISLSEILVKGRAALVGALGLGPGSWAAAAAFFGGIALIALIDRLIPAAENPHEIREAGEIPARGGPPPAPAIEARMLRMGMLTALAIMIHNFPEGLATFVVALRDPRLGLPVMVAIALHNIPEGIAVSVPIYYATGSRRRAFATSFLSGVAEPVGGLVGYLILRPYLGDAVFGALFAAVAGVMVFISLDQLLPTAEKYGEHHVAIYGLVAGMAVMAASLLAFL